MALGVPIGAAEGERPPRSRQQGATARAAPYASARSRDRGSTRTRGRSAHRRDPSARAALVCRRRLGARVVRPLARGDSRDGKRSDLARARRGIGHTCLGRGGPERARHPSAIAHHRLQPRDQAGVELGLGVAVLSSDLVAREREQGEILSLALGPLPSVRRWCLVVGPEGPPEPVRAFVAQLQAMGELEIPLRSPEGRVGEPPCPRSVLAARRPVGRR